MTINPFQSGLTAVGHFDFLDADLPEVRGGEVVMFDSVGIAVEDKTTADSNVFIDGYRTILRLATGADNGPFFFADVSGSSSFPSPGFEMTSLFATNQSFSQNLDSSGKVAVYVTDGFYSISSDVVDTSSVNEHTLVNTLLYVNPNGKLTATASSSGKAIAYFIQYLNGTTLRSPGRPIQSIGAHRQGDTVIVYKSSKAE